MQLFDPSSYAFSAYAVPLFVVGVMNLCFGMLVLVHERGSSVSRAYVLLNLSSTTWLLGFAAIYSTTDASVALTWSRIDHIGLVALPITQCIFAGAMTGRLRWNSPVLWAALPVGVALLALAATTDWLISDMHHYYWGYYPIYGWPVVFLLGYFSLFTGVSLWLYWTTQKQTQSVVQRRRAKAMLVAMAIGNLATIDFLPALGIGLYPAGYVFLAGFLWLTGRAVWRDRLVDITPALAAREIVDTMGDGLLVLDRDGVTRVANDAAARLLGWQQRSPVGTTAAELDAATLGGAMSDLIRVEADSHREVTYRRPDDMSCTVIVSSTALRDRRGEWVGTVCIMHDISERKLAEETLRASEDLYRTLVETSSDAVIMAQQNGTILMVNGRAAELFGLPPGADIRGRNALEFLIEDDRGRLIENFRNVGGAAVTRDAEYTIRRHDGIQLSVELNISRIRDANGDAKGIVAVARDITERKRAEAEIRHLAFHDVLTGAANRSLLFDRMTQAIARARRDGTCVGLIYLDLDGFKEVNDRDGHEAGDELLKRTAGDLSSVLREHDTLARVGGDEFVLLLPALADAEETELVARRVVRRLNERKIADAGLAGNSASLGIASFPGDGNDPETLLRNADVAMYATKRRGGNDYQSFSTMTAPAPSAADAPDLQRAV